MRLTSGGIREMHWHQFNERPYMTNGNCRMTALDEAGRPYIGHVKEGDLWYFPAGFPHSLKDEDRTAASSSTPSTKAMPPNYPRSPW